MREPNGARRRTKGGIQRHGDKQHRIRGKIGGRAPLHGYSDETLAIPSDFLNFSDNYRPQRVAMGHNSEAIAFVKGCVGIEEIPRSPKAAECTNPLATAH